jgi:signal transduction histidine kinase
MVDRIATGSDRTHPIDAGTDRDVAPTLRELAGWHADMARALMGSTARIRSNRRQARLIESLTEVAESVTATDSPADVLRTVVDEAKTLLGTDKAVVCLLAGDGHGLRMDASAVFVRGARDRYPEAWWREKIADVAASSLQQRVPIVSMVDRTWLMTVPIHSKRRPIAVLAVINGPRRRFRENQIALLAVLGVFAGTAVESARLRAQSQYALLSDERSRIAKEMHDGLSQSLFGTSLELDVCRKRVIEHPAEVAQRLDHVQTVLVRSLSELRRYIHDLRPLSLNTLGLVGALHQRVTEMGEAEGVSIRVYTEGEQRPLSPGAEACLYRVGQEAVSNVTKHAKASHAVVMLRFEPARVRLSVEDDGRGFDINEALRRVEKDDCIGLRSMRDRVQSEGGHFSISSGSRGTMLEVSLPC